MSYLVLLNGAPGVGKSTAAAALAQSVHEMSVLDLDAIKHALPGWSTDPDRAGLEARRIAADEIARRLSGGSHVVLGQYLARTEFIDELEALAIGAGAIFVEVVLELDAPALATRLARRSEAATRPEHAINNRLVGPDDAEALVASLEPLRAARPNATWIGCASLERALVEIRTLLI